VHHLRTVRKRGEGRNFLFQGKPFPDLPRRGEGKIAPRITSAQKKKNKERHGFHHGEREKADENLKGRQPAPHQGEGGRPSFSPRRKEKGGRSAGSPARGGEWEEAKDQRKGALDQLKKEKKRGPSHKQGREKKKASISPLNRSPEGSLFPTKIEMLS